MKVLLKNDNPILILQGGTGSSKTYSILQFLIMKCLTEWDNKTIDILRRTYPALRISVMKDFFDILNLMKIYVRDNHNKSEGVYKIRNNTIRFYSSDDEQKVRGPRRHVVYFNELLEFKKMDVTQVMLRTHELILGDYNPSEEFHWVYDGILTRDDVNFHKSTYLDNPFLPERAINEILELKRDPNMWRIYGLGERGVTQATIYSNWDYTDQTFEDFEGQKFFGLDFGFNNPTALLRVKYHENGIFIEQLIYKRQLTSDMVVRELEKLEAKGYITKDSTIYADSARPEMIEDIRKAGFNIHPALKEKDSVLRGINFIKRHKVFLPKESVDLIKEFRTYKWKVDKDDHVLDVPVDLNDHLCLLEGTLITTSKGQKPIEKVEAGERVLTRKGFKKVLISRKNSDNAELYEATFWDGRTLIGTGNHPIYTDKGLVRLDALRNIHKPIDISQKPLELRILRKLGHTGRVYNLTVEDQPEYYANNILSKNCDAARYALCALSKEVGYASILSGGKDIFG